MPRRAALRPSVPAPTPASASGTPGVAFRRRGGKLAPKPAELNPPPLLENREDAWLSTSDLAKFLSVSPNAVRIMVCRGLIPAVRMRGRLRFRRRDCAPLFRENGA